MVAIMAETSLDESESKPTDDIPLPEFLRMVAAVTILVSSLLAVEIVYRWFVAPANSLLPIQLAEAAIWSSLSNLIWPGSTELVMHSSGVMTQVNLNHPNFYSGEIWLYVSDECAGVHEIVFLSSMILLTPGVSLRRKGKHIAIASTIILSLNMLRLLLLFPLAVRGCASSPGQWGCDAPLWIFHEFILRHGFLIALVVGWTIWFQMIGGRSRVAGFWRRLPTFSGLSLAFQPFGVIIPPRGHRPNWRSPMIVMGLIMAAWMVSITSSDAHATSEASAEACEGDRTTRCSNLIDTWEDKSGRVLRGSLIAIGMVIAPLLSIEARWSEEEE